MKENIIITKTYQFALESVKLYRFLTEASRQKEYVLSKQFLRSSTSIGANMEEANGATSKKDFIAKTHISFREAKETLYWLRLLRDSGYLQGYPAEFLFKECDEIIAILSAILTTSKRNLNNQTRQ